MKKQVCILMMTLLLLSGCTEKKAVVTDADAVIVDPNAPVVTAAPEITPAPVVSDAQTAEQNAAALEPVPETEPFAFKTQGMAILPLMEAAPVLAALGNWSNYYEADSCAYQGKDIFYKYSGFELTVNEDDGVNLVTSISIVDDTITVPFENGSLRIGDPASKLLQVLGGEEGKVSYDYHSEHVHLQISLKDGRINTIVFMAPEEY